MQEEDGLTARIDKWNYKYRNGRAPVKKPPVEKDQGEFNDLESLALGQDVSNFTPRRHSRKITEETLMGKAYLEDRGESSGRAEIREPNRARAASTTRHQSRRNSVSVSEKPAPSKVRSESKHRNSSGGYKSEAPSESTVVPKKHHKQATKGKPHSRPPITTGSGPVLAIRKREWESQRLPPAPEAPSIISESDRSRSRASETPTERHRSRSRVPTLRASETPTESDLSRSRASETPTERHRSRSRVPTLRASETPTESDLPRSRASETPTERHRSRSRVPTSRASETPTERHRSRSRVPKSRASETPTESQAPAALIRRPGIARSEATESIMRSQAPPRSSSTFSTAIGPADNGSVDAYEYEEYRRMEAEQQAQRIRLLDRQRPRSSSVSRHDDGKEAQRLRLIDRQRSRPSSPARFYDEEGVEEVPRGPPVYPPVNPSVYPRVNPSVYPPVNPPVYRPTSGRSDMAFEAHQNVVHTNPTSHTDIRTSHYITPNSSTTISNTVHIRNLRRSRR